LHNFQQIEERVNQKLRNQSNQQTPNELIEPSQVFDKKVQAEFRSREREVESKLRKSMNQATPSETISNQLARLNANREESGLFSQRDSTSSDDATVIQDLEVFLQD